MNASFQSFSDEIIKLSARKGLKLIREALGGKEMMKARRTAARRLRRAKRREVIQGARAELKANLERKKNLGRVGGAWEALPTPKDLTVGAKPVRTPPPGSFVTPKGLDEANRIAQLPGAIKQTTPGSQVFNLGRGGEGMATAVAKPGIGGQPAIQARKLFDPEGLSSEVMINRKARVGKAIGKNPNVAEFYGEAKTPAGSTMHFSEMVPGRPTGTIGAPTRAATPSRVKPAPLEDPGVLNRAKAQEEELFQKARQGTIEASRSVGFSSPQDLRRANMVLDPRTNTYKTVDFLPAKAGEFYRAPGQAENMIAASPTGERLLGRIGRSSTDTPQLMRHMGPGSPRKHVPKPAVIPPNSNSVLGKGPRVRARTKPVTEVTAPLRAKKLADPGHTNTFRLGT